MAKKIAIVHDWLNGMRGGEKVLEEMLKIFPEADIYTLFYEPEKVSAGIKSHRIFCSKLNNNFFIRKKYSYFLPLFPRAIESFNLQNYELIISSSHCVAKGIIPPPDGLHLCYLHSPMRYAWDQYYCYFNNFGPIVRRYIARKIHTLRVWDIVSSQRVDHFIANSAYVKQRIKKYYRREAEVIHPPIDTEFFSLNKKNQQDFFLVVSALVPYKRIDLLISAFNKLQKKLVVVGRGTERAMLARTARKNISFIPAADAYELRKLYQQAKFFIFAGVEDFGMAMAEAVACGTPLIAYRKGGAEDIIIPEINGIFIQEQTTESIIQAVEQAESFSFSPEKISQSAQRFSCSVFQQKMNEFINSRIQ